MAPVEEVIKDIGSYYNDRISQSLENIYNYRNEMVQDPRKMIFINLEINEIFKKIRAKLIKQKKINLIKKELEFKKKLSILSPIVTVKQYDDESGKYFTRLKKTEDFNKYYGILEAREINLWAALENLGMTSKERSKVSLIR